MIVTKEWIMANQTARGSWNAKQLNSICISWPPPKGWIGRIVGTEICDTTKDRFEKLAGEPVKTIDKFKDLQKIKLENKELSEHLARLQAIIDNFKYPI
jgi:hypothetical protein